MSLTEKPKNSENINLRKDFNSASEQSWRQAVEKLLKGESYSKTMTTGTYEGITLKPIYHRQNVNGFSQAKPLTDLYPLWGDEGKSGGNANSWLVVQEVPYSSPEILNRILLDGLKNGQTAVCFNVENVSLPDKESPNTISPEKKETGVTLSILEDWHKALRGIDVEKTPLFIKSGCSGILTGAFLAALFEREGKDIAHITGSLEADPLAELVIKGRLPASPKKLFRDMAGLTGWAIDAAPGLRTIGVDVSPYQNAGGSAVQELAFALGTGVEYLRQMVLHNLKIEQVMPRIRFTFAVGANFFMEIAKLRAARILWNRVVQAFEISKASPVMHFHCFTSQWNKTCYDPQVNILRTTTEALSAIIGGCDSLQVGAFDEWGDLPGDFSLRIARNIQNILGEESHIDKVLDPAGGSWYLETLTNQLAEKAWELFQKVEAKGGMLSSLCEGFPQSQIAETARKRETNLATRKDKLVGINVYPNLSETLGEKRHFSHPESSLENGDINKETFEVKKEKPMNPLSASVFQSYDMESLISAVKAGATWRDIRKNMYREKQGFLKVTPLKIKRGAQMFEKLRQAMENYKKNHGSAIKVFIVNLGPLAKGSVPVDFTSGFFQIAGFEVHSSSVFANPATAAQAVLDSGAPIVVICSSDDDCTKKVSALVSQINASKGVKVILMAGFPRQQVETLRKVGAVEFIDPECNAYEILFSLQKRVGVMP